MFILILIVVFPTLLVKLCSDPMLINGLVDKDNANINHTVLASSWLRNNVSPCLPLSILLIHLEGWATYQSIIWPPIYLLPSSHYPFVLTSLYMFLLVCMTYRWYKYLFMGLSAPQECELLGNRSYSLLILSFQLSPLTLRLPVFHKYVMNESTFSLNSHSDEAGSSGNHLIFTVSNSNG